MTLLTYPMQDNYETTLSQARNWAIGTVYVKTPPSFTMPGSSFTIVTVDPGTSKEQAFIMDSYNSANKTLNCSSITVNKWPWLAYTQQSHSIGAVVRISDAFANREAIANEFNTAWTKSFIDITFTGTTTGGLTVKSLTTAQRDALASPANGMIIYNSTTAVLNQYVWWTRTTFATAGATPASTTTSLWGTELATQAENTAWTASWSVWPLTATPDIMATTIQRGERLYAGASATGNDTYVVTMTPALAAYTTGQEIRFKTDVANTGACTININWLWAKSIKTQTGADPTTNDIIAGQVVSLVYDWTNMVIQNVLPIPNKAVDTVSLTRDISTASGAVAYNHNLWAAPRCIMFSMKNIQDVESNGTRVSWKDYCVYGNGATVSRSITSSIECVGNHTGVVSAVSSTTFTITRTKIGSPASSTMNIVATLFE